jgi:hypothetical protein
MQDTTHNLGIANIVLGSIGALASAILWIEAGSDGTFYAIPLAFSAGQIGVGVWGINVSARSRAPKFHVSPTIIPTRDGAPAFGAAMTIVHF